MQRINGQWSLIDTLTVLDTFLQLADFQMATQDLSNSDLMQALEKQNQTYLEKIVANQNEIKGILSQIKDGMSAE